MGWFDDFVAPVTNFVNSVTTTVNNAVVNPIADIVSNAQRGDIGNFVGKVAGDTGRVLAAPIIVASDLARGDIKGAGTTLGRTGGSFLNLQSGGANYLAQTGVGKSVLTSSQLDKATFGYSSDYYGYTSGARTLADRAYVSPADLNSTGRYAIKTAAIAGAATTYNAYYATGSKLPGYAKTAQEWGQTGVLVGGIGGALSKGDLKSAVNLYTGAGNESPIPEWLTPALPDGTWGSTPGSNSPGYGSTPSSVWNSSPGVSTGSGVGSSAAVGSISPLVGVALIVGAVILAKKSRVI